MQVKSKARVVAHGEVFTAEREVNAMLDLVKPETERIESRFLEPACGTGNFLVEILRRKLAVCARRHTATQFEWERAAVIATSSIYGIDLLPDNVAECRQRLFGIFNADYTARFAEKCKPECRNAVQFLLETNIMVGDALTLKHPETGRDIVFAEWSPLNGVLLRRRDFTLAVLLNPHQQMAMFDDQGGTAHITTHVRDYPPTHFLELAP